MPLILSGSRAWLLEPVLTVAAVLLLSAVALIPCADGLASLRTHGVLLAVMAATLIMALTTRAEGSKHAALIAFLYLLVYCLPGVRRLWPLPLPIILACYAGVVIASPALRASVRFRERGSIDRVSVIWITVFTVSAAVALITWRYASAVDMAGYRQFVPTGIPPWLIFAGALPFAMLNAAFEEVVWRGVLWQAVESAFGARAALAITSLSFGLAHYRGFPSGLVGVALATIYGMMMGAVRVRTGGLLGPWIAHVFADLVIYEMVAVMVLG